MLKVHEHPDTQRHAAERSQRPQLQPRTQLQNIEAKSHFAGSGKKPCEPTSKQPPSGLDTLPVLRQSATFATLV